MRQPPPPDALEELADFLDFAVPLRAAEMAYQLRQWRYTRAQATAWLTGEAQRAGVQLGGGGDGLQFTDGRPRTGSARTRAQRTAGELANGVAAAVLLAQLAGAGPVTVFGRSFGRASTPPAVNRP